MVELTRIKMETRMTIQILVKNMQDMMNIPIRSHFPILFGLSYIPGILVRVQYVALASSRETPHIDV